MRLELHLGPSGATLADPAPLALEAERLGLACVWSAESYGSDAISVAAWVAARTTRIGIGTGVAQIPARTPATSAMTALTLDHLTSGRFRLGLGVSSPIVGEGWHGVPFNRPLTRTREYVQIVRDILKRERPLEFHGNVYDLPLGGRAGRGKPLRSILHPFRPDLPIYLGAIGQKSVELAAEVADGWIPAFFAPAQAHVFAEALRRGFERGRRRREDFDVTPLVTVRIGDNLADCRTSVKRAIALYVGGMGYKGDNFYAELVSRYGYDAHVRPIQDQFLAGNHEAAAAAVPDALVDEVALVGPPARIADQLAAWREAGVDAIIASTVRPETLRVLAELML